jgi:flagellar basal body-associated protein FliL
LFTQEGRYEDDYEKAEAENRVILIIIIIITISMMTIIMIITIITIISPLLSSPSSPSSPSSSPFQVPLLGDLLNHGNNPVISL